jgi:hypothetical protein
MKKKKKINLNIQSTSNYQIFESSMQHLDKLRLIASLPAGCCAMNTQTATRKTSRIVIVLIVADVGRLPQVLLQAMPLLLMTALVCPT